MNHNKVSFIDLLEIKVRSNNSDKIRKRHENYLKWEDNYTLSPRGRIWVGWNTDVMSFDIFEKHEQWIHDMITDKRFGEIKGCKLPLFMVYTQLKLGKFYGQV